MKKWSILLLAGLAASTSAQAQVLTEWVENNPTNAGDKIALGYPVPIPVDTPIPFDGFRTYAGLMARHQDLAATTPWVHPENIGTTRAGRTIWAYRLGDEDFETIYGLPEPATLTNGGIHPREWQSPETVTGITELIAAQASDQHFYDYLRDNVNMIVVPVLNVDGFLQTQRYPATNYLQTDPDFPEFAPRDGRMRRKNMLGADDVLDTLDDHLFGVDLNRNSPPFWNTNPNRSSPDNRSIVHHGEAPQSEPEIQALDVAAHLGPIEQLRLYTDLHSFSQVHASVSVGNARLDAITSSVLGLFTSHHVAFPAGKNYFAIPPNLNSGLGLSNEYFTSMYQVPASTLEIEPSLGHPDLPGTGADYGGAAVNGHDGFILPSSEIRRVREQLAQSFGAVYYLQAGPASVQTVRYIDKATGAVVYEAEWDVLDDRTRVLHTNQIQPLQLGRNYTQWVAYNKPMRWREEGAVVAFQGVSPGFLSILGGTSVNGQALTTDIASTQWLDQPGDYLNYEDDAYAAEISLPNNGNNSGLVNGVTSATVRTLTWDMTGTLQDANPATVAYWANGHWNNYENTSGQDQDFGGEDSTLGVQITDQSLPDPFVIEPGIASAWGDPERVGEGFILEILDNGVAVMFWFTNDDEGGQDWYIAVGEVRGNRIVFPQMLRVSGGVFGDDFDPGLVTEESVGSAEFIWSGCDQGSMDWRIGPRHGRQNLSRLTHILGLDCGPPRSEPPLPESALWSGAWGDPTHNGEGFTVEMLAHNQALVFWFSFGPDGKRRWYFGIGTLIDGKLVFDNMLTTIGGFFAEDFDPNDVSEVHWGSLELELGCTTGTATYASVEEGFGSGQQNLQKLTNLDGLACTP